MTDPTEERRLIAELVVAAVRWHQTDDDDPGLGMAELELHEAIDLYLHPEGQ